MKNSLLYILLILLLFASCYKPDSLAEKYISKYNLAFPIANDTIYSHKFVPPTSLSSTYVPAGTTLYGSINKYPFYLSDFTDKEQIIRMLEPKIIFTDNFPRGISIQIDLYSWESEKINFLVDENEVFQLGTNQQTIISEKLEAETIELLKNSKEICFQPRITFTEDVPFQNLVNSAVFFRLSMNIEIEAAFKLN